MSQVNHQDTQRNPVVVMTGATAGIGAHALKKIASSGARVITGSRMTPAEYGETLLLDLSSLASVRNFAEQVINTLKDESIDFLVLNAGIAGTDPFQKTEDGFEATFAVNHLAHYLLARLLLPKMANNGRLIITTSDVHALAPEPLDVIGWSNAHAGGAAMKAYAASKLCNLLTARTLTTLDVTKEKNIQVVAYNPGLTVGTSLARDSAKWQQALMNNPLMHLVLRLGSYFIPMMYPGTPERAGEALAELTLGKAKSPAERVYVSLVRGKLTYPDPSELASNDTARDILWKESAKMVGLPIA